MEGLRRESKRIQTESNQIHLRDLNSKISRVTLTGTGSLPLNSEIIAIQGVSLGLHCIRYHHCFMAAMGEQILSFNSKCNTTGPTRLGCCHDKKMLLTLEC